MRAAVLRATGKPLNFETLPDPGIGPRDVLVRTAACGICGTDVHIQDGWGYTPSLPFVMGHETCGVVASIGANVERFAVGDRVVPNIFFTCGHCVYCRTNRETLCINLDGILGVLKHWGGYASYFGIPERQLFRLPNAISFTEGAIIADAVVTAVHAAETGRVSAGETVVILGVGGCGGAAVQVCAMRGARVIAVDRGAAKKDRALTLGAHDALDATSLDVVRSVRELTDGSGPSCVIDAVGTAATLQQGVEMLARGGRLVVLGYTQDRYQLDPRQIAVNELQILGTRSGGRQSTADAIHLVADKRWRSIVSDVLPVEHVNEALDLMRSGRALGRIVLTFD